MTHIASPDVARNVAMAVASYLDGARYGAQAAAEIDDACPQQIEAVDVLAVDLVGIAWTLGDTSLGAEQPFRLTLLPTPSRDGLSGYTIRLGGSGRPRRAGSQRQTTAAVA